MEMSVRKMFTSPEKTKYPYGYGLGKLTLLRLYMNRASVQKWSFILAVVPLLVMYLWMQLREYVLRNESLDFLDGLAVTFIFAVWGFLGLFWAYRRQVPQIVTVKGKPALILGLSMMIGNWSLAAYALVRSLIVFIESLR
jgi:hypothetical protein